MSQISSTIQNSKRQTSKILITKIQSLKKIKIISLSTAFTASCVGIVISLVMPIVKQNSQVQLPQQINLLNWRSQPSDNLEQALKSNAIAAQRYTFTSSTQDDLRIDLLYIYGVVDVPKHLRMIGLKPTTNYSNQRYLQASGHYVLFSDRDRAYLASCINPRGGSTVTGEQFMNNRNTYDITPTRIGLYLLGMTDLRDTRCLLTIMSIPLETNRSVSLDNNLLENSNLLESSYKTLENAWVDWYGNWGGRFPEG